MTNGKIVFGSQGLISTYTCTCGAGACEMDEGGVICLEELGGCGAFSGRHEE
jgi:hypothetical protein